ncbi:MAG: hypothetical protein AABY14_01495 [Nanoarchaeota archaeon]
MAKKSQAAMEFLMTYGWAILVVLVAIGALAYFGVLSPDRFLPSKCTLPSGIACIDHSASSAAITVRLQNGLGRDMTGVTVRASNCGSSSSPASISNGDAQTYTITCVPAIPTAKYSGILSVTYTDAESTLTHTKNGTIITRIE